MEKPKIVINETPGSTSALRPSNLVGSLKKGTLRVDARADKEFLRLAVKDPKITLRTTNNGLVFQHPSEQDRPNNTKYEVSRDGSEVTITILGMHVLVRPENPNDALTYTAFFKPREEENPIDLRIKVEADIIASARSHEWEIQNWGGEGLPLQAPKS